jgi:glycosyltransferase involved in cell wall biosynthesis
MANILITGPSLNEKDNVSGISSLVRSIINASPEYDNKFYHLVLGKKDRQKKKLIWLIKQFLVIPNTLGYFIKNEVDIVHLNTGFETASLVRDFIVFKLAKALRKQVLFHAHGGYYLMQPPAKNSKLHKIIMQLLYQSDAVVVLSEIEKEKLASDYNFTNSIVLPNAVDIADEYVTNNKNFNDGLELLYIGRIVKSKGIYTIVNAFKQLLPNQLSQFKFQLYGTGPDKDKLIYELDKIEGLNYKYNGVVGGVAKWEAFAKSQVFLLPSIYGEGLPIAMLEAMGCGCVCLVSNDASMAAVIQNGVNGLMVERDNIAMLTQQIVYVLNNRDKLPVIGQNAVQTIASNYNINKYMAQLNIIYNNIIL